MNELAVCNTSGRFYEGNQHSGLPITGRLRVFPISFVGSEESAGCTFNSSPKFIFREDSFDPITKVRRGRVYVLGDIQPVTWRIQDQDRKDLLSEPWGNRGFAQRLEQTTIYRPKTVSVFRNNGKYPVAQIGGDTASSFWNILLVEKQFDGVELVTLKATKSFGVIPELLERNIPQMALMSLKDVLDKIDISAGRLSAVDTVDRCRDALSIVFGALAENMKLDLGKGVNAYRAKELGNNGNNLITNAADVVRRLHSRGKPSEKEAYSTRALTDEDADLALNSLWFVLVELGWAR